MKKNNILQLIVAGSFACIMTAGAQEIVVKDEIAEKIDSLLVVGMTFDLTNVQVPSNRSYVYTPVVRSGDSVRVLPALVVNGRNRHILYERTDRNFAENNEYEMRRKNGEVQTFDYQTRTPYAKWMKKSEVALVIDECGCGWEALKNDQTPLFPINFSQPVVLKPLLAFQAPQVEAVKERAIEGSAFLDFPVNKIVIYPEYRNNPLELRKIQETIEPVKNDKYATITGVHIKGYASPEGSYSNNTYLAENRAKALSNYVKGLYDFKDAKFTIEFEPEDWVNFDKMVRAANNLENKERILEIIHADEPQDWDKREWQLKPLKDYAIIMRDIYPALRHSDYTVNYTIRNFTVEEAKELLYSDPKQLSLNEMFQVAQTYEPGSRQYAEVFEIAVRMYPDDPVSNLNAANTAIQTGQLDRAKRYLAKANASDNKLLAEAAIAMLEGDLDKAENILNTLKGKPSVAEAVANNLEQIRLKREE